MMRPWRHSTSQERIVDGEKLWMAGDSCFRRTMGTIPGAAALSIAQKRKCTNLFFSMADENSMTMTAASVEEHMASRHLQHDDALLAASRSWFECMSDGCDSLTLPALLERCTVLLAEPHLPDWLLQPSKEQWRITAAASGGTLSKTQFVEWRTAVQRYTPRELEQMQRMDAMSSPTLDDVFGAANSSRDGCLTAAEYDALVLRWWTVSEQWDEATPYSWV